MSPSEEFSAAASYLSNASSLSQVSDVVKLELYGLYKFVTVSHTPNVSKPGLLDFAGRAKWNSWQELGKKYSTQSDPDSAAQARYLEIAKSLGWKSDAAADDGLPPQDGDGERGSVRGVITGTGVFVSTMSAPKDDTVDDLGTVHGLAIAGDAQKLEEMLKADPSLDLNQKDGFGYTALHLACDRGNPAIVEVLLRHGVDQTLKASFSFVFYSCICAYVFDAGSG
ncbi:ankyrin [Thelephora terrestris]|uniref:Ankyrin n=1 Tax=Thelephora terrestris TaxID=56493 RepID=A0A9P6L8Y3_9AGAM|nr:ankyrin [Thelephora terrestris]